MKLEVNIYNVVDCLLNNQQTAQVLLPDGQPLEITPEILSLVAQHNVMVQKGHRTFGFGESAITYGKDRMDPGTIERGRQLKLTGLLEVGVAHNYLSDLEALIVQQCPDDPELKAVFTVILPER